MTITCPHGRRDSFTRRPGTYFHEVAQRAGERRSLVFVLFRIDLNHIINSRGKKMIDICRVGIGVKYRSLSY